MILSVQALWRKDNKSVAHKQHFFQIMFVLRNRIILKLSKKRNPCRAGESHPRSTTLPRSGSRGTRLVFFRMQRARSLKITRKIISFLEINCICINVYAESVAGPLAVILEINDNPFLSGLVPVNGFVFLNLYS